MPGQLFTHYFLNDGIKATAEWRSSDTAFAAFRSEVAQAYTRFKEHRQPNEAVTEQELIRPVLKLLGWTDYLPQQGATRNEDIPDYLLFTDAAARARATARPSAEERYQDAAVVAESKRFGLALDTRDQDTRGRAGTPHGQLLRYLAPFARDLGYAGPPFRWDAERRRHLRARLDALYFHLYGLSREDADYILGTFPIVRRQDKAQFGRYRTRDLILAYMNALAAGDTESAVAV